MFVGQVRVSLYFPKAKCVIIPTEKPVCTDVFFLSLKRAIYNKKDIIKILEHEPKIIWLHRHVHICFYLSKVKCLLAKKSCCKLCYVHCLHKNNIAKNRLSIKYQYMNLNSNFVAHASLIHKF